MKPVQGTMPRGKTPRGTHLQVHGHSGCGLLVVSLVGDKERNKLCCSADALTPDTQADGDRLQQLIKE